MYSFNVSYPVRGMRLFGKNDQFMMVSTDTRYAPTSAVEIYGPPIEPLNIIGTEFQETDPPYGVVQDYETLAKCDGEAEIWKGVVADGVSMLLLRWNVPGPGTVQWNLKDPEALLPDDPPVGVGMLSDISGTPSGTTIETDVQEVDGQYFAFALFTAPLDFDRFAIDASVGQRPVDVVAYHRGNVPNYITNTASSLEIHRPPVLMMHGWMGSPNHWQLPAFLKDPRFSHYSADYRQVHGRSIDLVLQARLVEKFANSARLQKQASMIVSCQIDVVMHSMGGLHVRAWMDNPDYQARQNATHGDFHKLLFLDTPHYGSRLANTLVEKRGVVEHLVDQAFPELGMSHRTSSYFELKQIDGASIRVNSEGVLVASSVGTATIAVVHGTYLQHVSVQVFDGSPSNNAPHADAGSSYAACDSQMVFLDGSASHDLDEVNGDVLTYEWDLDADGEFDDATGETPFVQLLFNGEYWLIGLRVRDSAGAESVDYAYLQAGAGCLEGKLVCAPPAENWVVWDIDVDAAGNIYRAGYELAGETITKFTPQCELGTAFHPFPLNGMSVTSDGTIYTSPNNGIVKRYLSDGTPLANVVLSDNDLGSDFVVDDTGLIYCNDYVGNDNAIRKFDQSGTLLTTWNVDQATGGQMTAFCAVGNEEDIYVILDDERIARAVVDQAGDYALQWTIGGHGVDVGFFNSPTDIAIGPSGLVYVCESGESRVQAFDENGAFVRMWIGSKQPGGGFTHPEQIAVGVQEQLLILDNPGSLSQRIQVMETTQSFMNAEIAAFTRKAATPTVLDPQPTTPAVGCPQGDDDEIVVTVALDPASVSGVVPKEEFRASVPSSGDAILYVSEGADSDATFMDGKYRTTITLRQFGGCAVGDLIVRRNGSGIGIAAVDMRSPDILTTLSESVGRVGGGDFGKFGTFYQSPPKPYNPCADFVGTDSKVDASDFAHFGVHYGHDDGVTNLRSSGPLVSQAILSVEVEEQYPLVGSRRVIVTLAAENLEAFTTLIASIRSGNPRLRYISWQAGGSYAGATMGAEITRDSEKQVFIGILGDGKAPDQTVTFGRAEFEVIGDAPLTLSDQDFEFLIADLGTVTGGLKTFSALKLQKTEVPAQYQFGLAQNYPNPFNPATTIIYSLAEDSDISLIVFDVRGGRVKTLVSGPGKRGVHRLAWNGTDDRGVPVSSGVYFCRLVAGSSAATRKMVLLR